LELFGDCWNCFYRQHRLFIDGKYSSDAGLSTTLKQTLESFKDSRRISSGGIAFLYVQEAQERDLSHSEIPTAVGSGEAAQMLSAGVKHRK
jgi:hypothetical protein